MLKELDDYRKILFLPPLSLKERITDLKTEATNKFNTFAFRPVVSANTLQGMPPEIFDRIIAFVEAGDVILLSRGDGENPTDIGSPWPHEVLNALPANIMLANPILDVRDLQIEKAVMKSLQNFSITKLTLYMCVHNQHRYILRHLAELQGLEHLHI
ncbi:hypothetical protein HK100_006354 [Physocladia obscura]|uniref:Uncharacterized protein n=1 Tax=Physocladia obscura TaxID=109957 RepID=A0AAD5SRW0_9FUNG|nr:hypothetical protein HK100_006354 [Physocladia obscura]